MVVVTRTKKDKVVKIGKIFPPKKWKIFMTFGFWIHVMLALLEPNFGSFNGTEIEWHESQTSDYTQLPGLTTQNK